MGYTHGVREVFAFVVVEQCGAKAEAAGKATVSYGLRVVAAIGFFFLFSILCGFPLPSFLVRE